MSWNDGLTHPYLDVAAYAESPLRVLAGPGTGKTFAIMRRCCRLLEDDENPKDILLAVDFWQILVHALHDLLQEKSLLRL